MTGYFPGITPAPIVPPEAAAPWPLWQHPMPDSPGTARDLLSDILAELKALNSALAASARPDDGERAE